MQLLNGSLIQYLRKKKGWDQQTLAHQAKIHPSVVSRLERSLQDDVKLSIVAAIAAALEVSIDSIVVPKTGTNIGPSPKLIPELEALTRELAEQPVELQRQAAGILRGYLNTLG